MGLSERLELLINADPSQGIAAMERFAKSTDKNITDAESSLKRFSSAALKIGGAGVGVGGLLTELGSKEQAAGQQLSAAVGQVGQSLDEYESRIEKTVDAQTQFGNTAPEVKDALTTLTLSYNDTGKALDEMQLVADLAARKHIDLASAASLVAKAHGGSAKVFKEFGIQVQQNADGTKDYDGALTELSQKLKGQASAAADTWSGRLAALKANVENVVGTFGEKFGPAILGVSAGLTALGGIGQGASAVLTRLRRSEDEASEGASSLGSKLGTAGVVAGAALAVGALYEYGQSLNKTTLDSEELSNITKLSGADAAKVFEELSRDSVGPFAGVLDDTIAKLVAMGPAGVGALQQIRDQYAANGKDTSKFDAALQGARESQDNLNTSTEHGTAVLYDAKEAEKNLTSQLAETTKQLDAQRTAQESLLGSRISVDEANLNYTDSLNKIMVAQAAANKATGVDAINAQEDLKKAVLASASAAEQLAQKTADQKIAQDAANGTTDSAAQKSQIQRDALKQLADQLSPDSPLRKYLDEYIYTLNSIPGQKDTVLSAHYDVNTQPTTAHTSARASGGPVMGGSSYLIGERGPEIVTFGASGFVTPNDKLGKQTIVQQFYGPANAEEQQAEAARRLRINAMLSRP